MADHVKDPAAIVSYTFDRSKYLAPGAKLTSSAWEFSTDLAEVAPVPPAVGFTDTTTSIKLSGGTLSATYTIYNTFETDDGQTFRAAFTLLVLDAADIRQPSDLEQQLAALRVAISEAAISGTAEYQIANRMKKRYSLEELLAYEERLVERVNAERRRANGGGFFKNVLVRPVEPGR